MFGFRSFRVEEHGKADATMDARSARETIEWWFADGEGRAGRVNPTGS